MSTTILELKRENKNLKDRLSAANKEIMRMHSECMRIKQDAAAGAEQLERICTAVYIGAALAFGEKVTERTIEVTLPYIDTSMVDDYELRIRRNDLDRTMLVKVAKRDGHDDMVRELQEKRND